MDREQKEAVCMIFQIRLAEKEKTPPAGEPWEEIFFMNFRRPDWMSFSNEAHAEHLLQRKNKIIGQIRDRDLF